MKPKKHSEEVSFRAGNYSLFAKLVDDLYEENAWVERTFTHIEESDRWFANNEQPWELLSYEIKHGA